MPIKKSFTSAEIGALVRKALTARYALDYSEVFSQDGYKFKLEDSIIKNNTLLIYGELFINSKLIKDVRPLATIWLDIGNNLQELYVILERTFVEYSKKAGGTFFSVVMAPLYINTLEDVKNKFN